MYSHQKPSINIDRQFVAISSAFALRFISARKHSLTLPCSAIENKRRRVALADHSQDGNQYNQPDALCGQSLPFEISSIPLLILVRSAALDLCTGSGFKSKTPQSQEEHVAFCCLRSIKQTRLAWWLAHSLLKTV